MVNNDQVKKVALEQDRILITPTDDTQENNGVKSRIEDPGCSHSPECISGISEQIWNHGIVDSQKIHDWLYNSEHRV